MPELWPCWLGLVHVRPYCTVASQQEAFLHLAELQHMQGKAVAEHRWLPGWWPGPSTSPSHLRAKLGHSGSLPQTPADTGLNFSSFSLHQM